MVTRSTPSASGSRPVPRNNPLIRMRAPTADCSCADQALTAPEHVLRVAILPRAAKSHAHTTAAVNFPCVPRWRRVEAAGVRTSGGEYCLARGVGGGGVRALASAEPESRRTCQPQIGRARSIATGGRPHRALAPTWWFPEIAAEEMRNGGYAVGVEKNRAAPSRAPPSTP